jgi:MGT family glycosyltransferase
MSNVLIATWHGGGASLNALRIGRELAERGNAVRVSAPARFTDMIRDLGCEPVPHPPEAEFDPALGRALDDQTAFMRETFFGPRLADAVRALATERRPDVIVIDYLLRSVMVQAEALGVTTVSLMHMASTRGPSTGSDADADAEWGWRWQYDQVNSLRTEAGLAPLTATPEISATLAQACRAARVLVTLPRELDSWVSAPENVIYVGPINESRTPAPWHSPWPQEDDRPLFVVTFGTTYMHQEELMERVLDTLAPMTARVLVLTGEEFGSAELPARPDVRVENYVPHESVFPHARLVLTHGGMGTLLECLRAGVPSICISLGRDQHDNARAASALHATVAVDAGATTSAIGAAIDEALHSPTIHNGVAAMAQTLTHYGGAATAADEIEHLATAPAMPIRHN